MLQPGRDMVAMDTTPRGRIAGALALGLLAMLAVSACEKATYPACKKDKQCNAALAESCVAGVCQGCKQDGDCAGKAPLGAAAYVCADFRCQDPGAIAGGREGCNGADCATCTGKDDCSGGLTCIEGKCAACSSDAECGGVTCNLETGRCGGVESCATDDQCAMDEICDAGKCIFSGELGNDDGGPCGLPAIYFGFDGDKLDTKAVADLEGVVQCVKDQSTTQGRMLYLEAHADNRGTEEYNILLTERRGSVVKSWLVEHGVAVDAMQVIAKGDLEASGTDEASRASERRVQFIWPQ